MNRNLCAARRAFVRNLGALLTVPVASRIAKGGTGTNVCLFADDKLARYGFPGGHPFGVDRQGAFLREARERGLLGKVRLKIGDSVERKVLERFHQSDYVDRVRSAESIGLEYLDPDTPVFPDVFQVASYVVGSAIKGLESVMDGDCARTFQPIGGLHHAGRGHSAGFCVFSDLGVVIETLRRCYGVRRIAYVDIDVHFGDGVFYAFEEDPGVIIADIHQDPRGFYPGTGFAYESGKGEAAGTKLNIPLLRGSGDDEFRESWPRVERHLERFAPEFFVFQCGADGLSGDPIAGLRYTHDTHTYATKRLLKLAERFAKGRLMAFGGGGYNRTNLGKAWSAVLAELLA